MRAFGLAFTLALIVATTSRALALDLFDEPQSFVVERACDATVSIAGRDPVPLVVGQSYLGRGLNRSTGATHVLIRLGNQERWVALSCGRLEQGVPQATEAPLKPQKCLAFFDQENNPIAVGFGGTADMTPPPPSLDDFDKAVLAACGPAGKVVTRDEFKVLMSAHPDVLERIRTFAGSKVFASKPPSADTPSFLEDLTEAWFAIHAFDHIMCGEPGTGRNTIGGLHFRGRYLQLQESGEACRMDNYRQNEVVPGVIYTMGVQMRTASGGMARHAIKGYGLTLDAQDIMAAVTRAFAENPTASSESTACLLGVEDDGTAFTAVFVRRAGGIRTFYPDATPNGDRSHPPAPACAGGVNLQNLK